METVRTSLKVAVTRPEPDDYRTPFRIQVRCPHGELQAIFSRGCPNGCSTPEARAQCEYITPSLELLNRQAALAHLERTRCSCQQWFWLLYGPNHRPICHQGDHDFDSTRVEPNPLPRGHQGVIRMLPCPVHGGSVAGYTVRLWRDW